TSLVGASTAPRTQVVDSRWLMAYAAGIDDEASAYFDTTRRVVGHPLFPVCVEWPLVLAARDELDHGALTPHERRRAGHATHGLTIGRLVQAGDGLTTVATVECIEPRKPGAYEVLRLDTTDATGALVATTRMGSLFLGVSVDGSPAGELVSPPVSPPRAGV